MSAQDRYFRELVVSGLLTLDRLEWCRWWSCCHCTGSGGGSAICRCKAAIAVSVWRDGIVCLVGILCWCILYRYLLVGSRDQRSPSRLSSRLLETNEALVSGLALLAVSASFAQPSVVVESGQLIGK
jgi:hypothetical protein